MKEEIKYYNGMIELHDNHTFWKLDNKTLEDNEITTEEIYFIMQRYVDMFKDKTGVELCLLGRSGRHICVEDNDYNKRHYKSFKRLALKLEKMFIDDFNSIDFNNREGVIKDNKINLKEVMNK